MSTFATALPESFYIDLAIGLTSFEDLCSAYEVDPDEVREHDRDPLFVRRLMLAKQVVDDDGRAFRARCRSIVNNSVHKLYKIMNDPDVSASTQLDAFKTLARFGDMEPKAAKEAAGAKISLTIIAPGGAESGLTIEHVDNSEQADPTAEIASWVGIDE